MKPKLRTMGPCLIAGLVTRASNEDPSPIGALWGSFMGQASELGVDAPPIAVYHDYESDHRGEYSLLVGVPVRALDAVPEGWRTIELPPQSCLAFRVPDGPMPDALIETWQTIWDHFDDNCPLERTFTTDVELHADPVEILIAVRTRERATCS